MKKRGVFCVFIVVLFLLGCLFLVGCQLNDDAQDNGKADKTPVDMQDNVDNDIKEQE